MFKGKLMVLFIVANLLKKFPLAAVIKIRGIKDIENFNGTFYHNMDGKKYVN